MADLFIEWNNVKIFYYEIEKIDTERFNRYCPLCGKKAEKNLIVLLNNDQLFPNIMIHKECFKYTYHSNKTFMISYIINQYKKYEKFKEEYKAWLEQEYK